ncbi:MAG: ATP-binding protein [Bacteroidales bacterium]
MPPTSHTRRSVLRIVLAGGVVMLVVLLGGWLIERSRLGATDADAFERLERQVRSHVDRSVESLKSMASALASEPGRLTAATDNQAAARRLFDVVDEAWRGAGSGVDMAISVYGPSGEPLAWTGRPSELNRRQIVADRPSLFPAPERLGLRLVYVLPVFDKGLRRAGAVVTEELLSTRRGIVTASGDLYTLATERGTVSLRTRAEGAGEGHLPNSFQLRSPDGEVILEATVDRAQLQQMRTAWRQGTVAVALLLAALTILFLVGPLLTVRMSARRPAGYVAATSGVLVALVAAWLLTVIAGHQLSGLTSTFSPVGLLADAGDAHRALSSLLQSPFDYLLCGLLFLALVGLAFDASERWRLRRRRRRLVVTGVRVLAPVAVNFVLAAAFATLLGAYQLFLRAALERSGIDILHFSVNPWNSPQLAVAVGLLLGHAAMLWLGVLLFRLAGMRWLRPRGPVSHLGPIATWLAAFVAIGLVARAAGAEVPWQAAAVAYVAVVLAAAASRHVVPQFRHASQGLRLVLGLLALLLPAIVMYPTLARFAEESNRHVIETDFAPEVMNQREAIKSHVANSLDEVDAIPGLADVVEAASGQAGGATAETAFWIWSRTALARHRIASAVEIYRADGTLVSRFALYLPEYKSSATQPTREQNCSWDLYEYVSPFGAEQRKLLRAGRALCVDGGDGRPMVVGSIVIHAMLDYSALPFLSSQSPYYELLRPAEQRQRRNMPGGDLDLTVYGWSRAPIYTSAAVAWPLDASLFSRVYRSRRPFWTRISAGGATFLVYFMNDRGGIYALGYPQVPFTGHLVNIAEMTTLVGLTYVVMIAGSMLFTAVSGHGATSGRALLREIRASFYRKLFLAFVAVAVVPVITLAWIAQAYIGGRLRADTEAAAVKTTAVGQRVIEDYGTFQQQAAMPRENTIVDPLGTIFGDDVLVGLSRVIDQDVNLFVGPRLMATSERDLFESQLLPMRTPADVYRAIALDRQQSFVGQERTGEFTYMLAATPVRVGGRDAILTVPLMLRQHEIEREIDDLNRRVVLATLLFILIGAAIGYPMAERIADPVNRLTRATRRIARGELDARIAATSSDELRRLVEAFNSMAADLQSQRAQLERTNRLEAWAEMARQVAHEIKNPLTPIQLSAEHLQRVHSDKGRPLSPVLEECIASILAQVRLLRQISGEFSSFASSPTARPSPTPLGELVEEVVGPYRSGLWGRVELREDVPASLPDLFIDRVLVGRALANVIENALHAMPGTGTLQIAARDVVAAGRRYVELAVTDTGIGMDAQALGRLFEPYFSTKAIGTGLGLAIAKRNIELNGGTIQVQSEKGKGTTVSLRLPAVTP